MKEPEPKKPEPKKPVESKKKKWSITVKKLLEAMLPDDDARSEDAKQIENRIKQEKELTEAGDAGRKGKK
jgi:hypothetical protein